MKKFYVPVLKWKMGEYNALFKLSDSIKEFTLPLIEVPPIGWDFQEKREAKTIEDHIKNFPKWYGKKWGNRPAFIDTHLLKQAKLSDGRYPLEAIFEDLNKQGITPIPTVRVGHPKDFHGVLKKIKDKYNLSRFCFRITLEDMLESDFEKNYRELFSFLQLKAEECDLVLDLEAPNFTNITGLAKLVWGRLQLIPFYSQYYSTSIIACSFPESMAPFGADGELIPREEWILYKEIFKLLKSGADLPNFGDYPISHPNQPSLDMRLIKTKASIKYTVDNAWYIIRGKILKAADGNGYAQYRDMSKTITDSKMFLGADYSEGDKFIAECANSSGKTGNTTSWVEVANNHHITKVVNDLLANAYAA